MDREPGKWLRQIPTRVFVGVLCLGLLVPSSAAGGSKKEQKKNKKEQQIQLLQQVPLRWRIWLDEEVYPLITKEQRQAFLSLDTDAQRRSFAERLWIVWGRQSGLGSAFRGIYGERLELARLELGNTVEDRARVLLIHGPPTFHHNPRCDAYFVPMDFWVWPYIEGIGEDVVVLFYQRDLLRGHWRLWTFIDGYQRLKPFGAQTETGFNTGSQFDGPAFRCPNGDVTMRLLASAAQWSRDARYLRGMNHFPEIDSGGGRLESSSHRFMEFSALLDEDAEPLEFSITNNERAARGGLVQVGFAVDVDVDGLGTTPVGNVDVVQLDVVGEITSREEVMVDKFRYLYSVPHAGDKVGLLLDRLVRPGKYQLRLKVEDVHSKHAAIKVYDFDVDPSLAVAEADDKLGDFADEYGTGMLIGTANEVPAEPEEEEEQPTLRLVGPEGDAVSGLVRFNALVRPEVAKVTFFLDNEAVLTKNRPPFDLDLNIGPLPKLTAVMVVGYDASGKEIARDGYSLNVGRERFYVRLKPISASDTEGDRVRVEAELNIPSDGELERLELFWNDEPLATIHEAPYEASVALNAAGQFGYLRALATLSDDSQAEDIQFVNSPQFGTVVKVTAIELPVTVLDNHGDPVIDLTIDDFTVYEDKVEQTISHFSLHRDLPVRMGIVIDTSGSMTTTLPTVQRVVMGFLRDFLRPRDRAFIETFSDRPDILAGFTANFNIIENALLALYADRSTALYDAVIMGLFQFSGVTGRRAMIVLSDGEDTASDNEFSDAFGYAQRMGVTIYTIGINIPTTKITTRWQISKLASVTGGRAFFVSEKSEIGSIYDEINRELRTQYLIAFTSKSEHPPDQLRKIKVVVDRKKVKVRTITGYYPVGG